MPGRRQFTEQEVDPLALLIRNDVSCAKRTVRLAAMEMHRRRLAGLSVAEQLALLLADPSIPIEHYPLGLAPQVTTGTISLLEPSARVAMAVEVARTPLGRWRRLSTLLRPEATD